MEVKKIVLVDDHTLVRNALKMLIERLGDYEVAHEFDNGAQFLRAYPALQGIDLILLDLNMPELNGQETVDKLNELGNESPILILTLNNEEHTIVSLFRAGVRGYLQKDCSADQMREALNAIFTTGYYHNEFLRFSLLNDTPAKKMSEQEKILNELSDREREFLKLVCHEDEYTYDQIGGIMGVQHRTVDGYRESIFDKFAIKSKTGLVLFVLKHDLISLL